MSLRTRFARLRQKHGVSIGVFKQEYDELKATLIGAGVPAMPDAEDAMEFLSKLDMVRYGEMFSFLTNRAHLGESFPATLHDARQVASKWTVSGPVGGKMDASGELLSVFTLADERAPPLRSGRGGGRDATGGVTGAGASSESRRSAAGGGVKISSSADQVETRTCRGCLKKGHLQRDCTDNRHEKTGVMVAADEDDEEDDDLYGVTLMNTEHSPAGASGPVAMAALASADTLRSTSCRRPRWSTRATGSPT
jgi:hypothetical protein